MVDVKTKYMRKTHEHGTWLPKNIKETLELDTFDGSDYMERAI